jgi:hypothetical protein
MWVKPHGMAYPQDNEDETERWDIRNKMARIRHMFDVARY